MKISGTHTLRAPRERVYVALQDPAVLVRTLPGCQELRRTADGCYAVTVLAGVASIKGLYAGEVTLTDQDPPYAYTLQASGQGAPGTVDATARMTLSDADGGGTQVRYDAEAVVGGMVGGVGQRVLLGVAKRMAEEFFTGVDADLAGERPAPAAQVPAPVPAAAPGVPAAAPGVPAAAPGVPAAAPGVPAAAPGQGPVGEVFRAPAPVTAVTEPKTLLAAALAGGVLALLGVLVGRRLAR